MNFVEFFWASWLGMILVPMALMALLLIGALIVGGVGVGTDRVREFFGDRR